MSVNYASKYSPSVDERFALGSLTQGIVNQNYEWIGVSTVTVYSVPTVALGNYTLTGSSRYGTPSELGNEKQDLTITKDRSFTFTIDRKSFDDTMMTMEAGKALRRQIDEVVIPEIDAYRISALVSGALASHTISATVTSSNAYSEFLKVQEQLDDAKAPVAGRVCICTPAYHNFIKLDETFTKKGDMATTISLNGLVGEIDGVPTVKAPTSYFPTGIDFVITNAAVMPAPVKLEEYKVHDDAPGISGWLVEGRVRYDAFVLTSKKAAVGVHKH